MRRAIFSYSKGSGAPLPSDAVLRATLSRMKKQGLLTRSGIIWRITDLGQKYFEQKVLKRKRKEEFQKMPKNLIIAFDIPERDSQKRFWLRFELRNLGFEMIQKSVWFGPGPLSKEFINKLHQRRLLPYLKFFKARSEEIV